MMERKRLRRDMKLQLVDGKVAEVGAPEELEQRAGAIWWLYFG